MNKLGFVAVLTALVLVLASSASAVSWTVDKSVVVTGDYKWNGASWTLPNPRPVTATYGFQASGLGDTVSYAEAEVMGLAWKYSFNNNLVSNSAGAMRAFADITTVNKPIVTPGTAYTQYMMGTQNAGTFTTSTLIVSGSGFAHIDNGATFKSPYTSNNFVCINDCTT